MAIRTKVFVSYSHRDAEWLNRLRVHLRPLEREYEIDVWDDTKITPGSNWRQSIAETIAAARVAVLLVSADFLASDFIASDELPPLLKRAEGEGAVILPVIVSPSRFAKTKTLCDFQSVNPPSSPLVNMTRGEQEAVFVRVGEAIESALATVSPAAAGNPAAPAEPVPERASVPTAREQAAASRRLEEMFTLFEDVHQEYMASFRRYRESIQATRGAIRKDHPVVDAIRSDHVFTGGPRAKLLAMIELDLDGPLAGFAVAVGRYLEGIRRKETYFQIPNGPRMDFQREFESFFVATPKMYEVQLQQLKANTRYQQGLRKNDPSNPLLALLDSGGTVTAKNVEAVKAHQILAALDAVVEKTQGQYAKVNREYLAAKRQFDA